MTEQKKVLFTTKAHAPSASCPDSALRSLQQRRF
jgi:hypothetical protein